MTIEQSAPAVWTGHSRGSAAYGRLLAALFCAGVATFAQLYSPQAVLPMISRDLHIGAATVKSHLIRVFAKLGVESRTAAVTVAMERGILPPPGS